MSKITFRADDELVERVERLDASKSEVMREALRAYLDDEPRTEEAKPTASANQGSIDALIEDRVDTLVADRLEQTRMTQPARDVNITLNVEPGTNASVETEADETVSMPDPEPVEACPQCGESLAPDHVYCPNCGEQANGRTFCDCGTELQTDWAHCPSCGRRTPTADVLGE